MKLYPIICYPLLLSFFALFFPVTALCETANLLSLQEGCLPVVVPPTYNGWDAQNVLDDSPSSGWAGDQGRVNNNVFVFEMASEAVLERFEFDTAAIEPESYPILAEVLALLKNDTAGNLSVDGHTDSSGSAERNQVLSRQRAESVKAYLVAGGIAAERLATAGFGAGVPVADNGTELGRAQNRRVELVRK